MQLENSTGIPAQLFRTILRGDRIGAAFVARMTYDVVGGQLKRCEEQPWIVSAGRWDGTEGPMSSDEILYRGGVDLLVFANACTPRGRPAQHTEVSISCGSFQHKLIVFGERAWLPSGKEPLISRSANFVTMPLSLAGAFGGKRPWDGIEIAFPDNPDGKGYFLSKEDAIGGRLPNIEDPRFLIRRWNDAPAPVGVGVASPGFGPRLRESLVVDSKGHIVEMKPTFFNAAFPGMVIPVVRPGDAVRLEGVLPDGPLDFVVPPSPLKLTLGFGSSTLERVPAIDQIGVQVKKRRVFISYRHPFRYYLNRFEMRSCRLTSAGGA